MLSAVESRHHRVAMHHPTIRRQEPPFEVHAAIDRYEPTKTHDKFSGHYGNAEIPGKQANSLIEDTADGTTVHEPRHSLGGGPQIDHPTVRFPHLLRREEAIESSAITEIEDRLSRTKCGNRLWVSASEAHIRAIRYRC